MDITNLNKQLTVINKNLETLIALLNQNQNQNCKRKPPKKIKPKKKISFKKRYYYPFKKRLHIKHFEHYDSLSC